MTTNFNIYLPRTSGTPLNFNLEVGKVLYLLGANGCGKSSLITQIFSQNSLKAKRISAHRQTWFESNTPDLNPQNRQQLGALVLGRDATPEGRYREDNASRRASMAIYDLIDSDTMKARKIADFVFNKDLEAAQAEASIPSPVQMINELMRLSNIPIKISVEKDSSIVAYKNGGKGYSVVEMSDGERNAFLIAAEVLTSKPGTLVLIDEPERHLHRSIIIPLFKHLLQHRNDCAFVISTHEPFLPLDMPNSTTLLVRSCEYNNQEVKAWTADLLEPGATIDDDLKGDILGSRRIMLFVEGTSKSLDTSLYSLLFPQVSVVAKDGCREVEYAVRGLRGASNLHWISAFGIVDRDQRSEEDVARLRKVGIWPLMHYSVESLYFHPMIIERISEKQTSMIGGDATGLVQAALTQAIASARAKRNHLIESAVLRTARNKILGELPSRNGLQDNQYINIQVDVGALRVAEEKQFDALVAKSDWDGLLARYPLRESNAFDIIVSNLGIKDRAMYIAAVLKLLRDDATAVDDLRKLLGDLFETIAVQTAALAQNS